MWIGFNDGEDNARFKESTSAKVTCVFLLSYDTMRCLSLNSAEIITHLYILGGILHPID